MMNWEKEEKLIQHILGELSADESASIQRDIDHDASLKREWERYQELLNQYGKLPLIKAGPHSAERFDEWLSRQQHVTAERKTMRSRISWWKYGIAASIVLLVGWFFMGQQNIESMVNQPKEQQAFIQLIANESATKRIKGVRQTVGVREPDQEVVEVLLKLLSTDESPNVRLTIVEGLQQYALNEQIKNGLIAALEQETQPVVQIAIINALVKQRESKVKPSLESLIEKETIQPFVKDEARLGLTRL